MCLKSKLGTWMVKSIHNAPLPLLTFNVTLAPDANEICKKKGSTEFSFVQCYISAFVRFKWKSFYPTKFSGQYSMYIYIYENHSHCKYVLIFRYQFHAMVLSCWGNLHMGCFGHHNNWLRWHLVLPWPPHRNCMILSSICVFVHVPRGKTDRQIKYVGTSNQICWNPLSVIM